MPSAGPYHPVCRAKARTSVSRTRRALSAYRCTRVILLAFIAFAALNIVDPRERARSADAPTADMVSDEPLLGPVITRHHLKVGTASIDYSATFAETMLNDAQGRPQATISATSYVREGVGDPAARPVLFLFNGGPGASSSPLHFNAFGPKRFARDSAGERVLVDNAYSLIDAADLVFIDPVGTGFSRERPGATSGAYWTPRSDAEAALTLIRQWLGEHHREQSPLFMAGESYGGFRLAIMMQDAMDLPLAGLIFISPMLDASGSSTAVGNDAPFIFDLPTMAVAAWKHHKVERSAGRLEEVYEAALRFAQSDYAVALQKGSLLAAADRDRLAARISRLIGLPKDVIAQANLRIETQAFLEMLLKDQGLLVGRLDTRVTAKKPEKPINPDRPPAANDPALGLGPTNLIKSIPIKTYMAQELGVHTPRDYLSLTLDVNFRWDWRSEAVTRDGKEPVFYINTAPNIAAIMHKKPALRVLLVGGYYDLAVPLLAPRYALEHAGIPMDRVEMQAFAAGHSPFEGEQNLVRGAEVMRDFMREHP